MHLVHRKLLAVIGVAVLVLLTGASVVLAVLRVEESRDRMYRVLELRASLDELMLELQQAESAQRGFLLTGDSLYLEPYLSVRDDIARHLDRIQQLRISPTLPVGGESRPQRLQRLFDVRLTELAGSLELRDSMNARAVLREMQSGVGRAAMDTIRSTIADLKTSETAELDESLEQLERWQGLSLLIVGAGSLLAFFLLIALVSSARRDVDELARVRDLLERQGKELASQREDALAVSRAKSDFLGVMSHELRTPLNAVIGYTSLLLDEMGGPVSEEQRRYLDRVRASATHLVGLVDEILTFSRLEADVETVRAEPTMLQHLVEDAVTLVEPMIVGKGLTLHVDVPDAPVTLTTDPAKVRQILVNLLGNATKFTDAGSIALRASCEPRAGGGSDREAATGDSVVIVEVEDTGVGIAPEHLDHIFEPFTQVHHGRTRAVGGTGLGLAVSRQLATLLGGALTVSSEVGRGSVFRLTLPLAAPRGATMVDVLRGGNARLTKPATAPA